MRKAVGMRLYIIVHTPNPVGAHLYSFAHTSVETARSAYVLLVDDMQVRLGVEPFAGAIGTTIVDHNYCLWGVSA